MKLIIMLVLENVMMKKDFLENFSVMTIKLYYYTEFLKQVFAESEGKDGKGIFPISTVNTRDLHSLGTISYKMEIK